MSTDKKYHHPPAEKDVSARSLHAHAIHVLEERELEERRKKLLARENERRAHDAFMKRAFTDKDLEEIERKTGDAVHAGLFEIEILRFPALYLTDHGRAINNNEVDWPNTLTGYAASLYAAYTEIGAPKGFRIIAKVLNYPQGFIGDIGLYLRW